MNFKVPHTLKQIAEIINAKYIGDQNLMISGTNEIHRVVAGEIVFVDHPKYYDKALQSAATVILIDTQDIVCPQGKGLLVSNDPFSDFNKINNYFKPFIPSNNATSSTAKVGHGTIIQPNVFLGNNVTIGNNCIIHANVVVGDDTVIGNNVIIQPGTVLGGDAFYYKNRPTGFDKLLSVGNVVVEDDVEIGSQCTIDRGVTSSTIIGKGSKLDNLIQIGHDTIIGKQCLIASQVGIAGCVIVQDMVTIWGQAGVRSGITIGYKAVVMGQTGVTKSIEGNKTYWGTPVQESKEHLRQLIALKRLAK